MKPGAADVLAASNESLNSVVLRVGLVRLVHFGGLGEMGKRRLPFCWDDSGAVLTPT